MNQKVYDFDVIVVGGGHAGIEAAHAAAKLGSKTLLITLDPTKIGLMPCNPAIGGVGKGHIVYDISALGGLMPRLCTQTYLQARMLNTKKGAAVQGLRLQIDKFAYSTLSQVELKKMPNLTIHGGTAEDIILDDAGNVCAVQTENRTFTTPTVILTTGTFLNGLCHIGEKNFSAGRRDEKAVTGLSLFLKKTGLRLGRLKTGTPPRLLKSSLDFTKMEYQEPDQLNYLFEFYPHKTNSSHACYITHTNENTHQVIKNNLHRSAMYNGNISGIGPRYCPSIEDKISRFATKGSHHVFVEPEGAHSDEIYPNGISTSLPLDVQEQYIRTIAGFENAIITKAGYAVEYDFVYPNQLCQTLEVITVPGLFLAGQINGTTGYEEAAGQGIIAGINAHQKAAHKPPFILDRTESYIGVMIDDLVSMSVDEPYRMFTSRAERRLLLRQDNAFMRLTEKAYNLGMVNQQLYDDFVAEKKVVEETLAHLRAHKSSTDLLRLFGQDECDKSKLAEYITTPLSERALQIVHSEIRYEPYITREKQEIKKTANFKNMIIPAQFNYTEMPGLSKELQQKLTKHKPQTIAHAALIPGMTPAAISLLVFRVKNNP
ncbi:MAG TPA: tRNA uridine-5-carboxymethylaminomethyl(34) synthesis enzyme MnmG [Candidatus Babeliales bacterium]|jgi:tRNA uridine 5-carboxymethylaminomethyl modification enzyme|nr:tRNA uridine-5-carboxymethylaminomethyl(34) synthesis enzyme MnmG [Candidatus Babeliales bacterium]